MSYFWLKFKSNRFNLLNYLLGHTAFLVASLFLMYRYDLGVHTNVAPSWLFLIVPLSIFLGLKITTWMHNCMHYNYRWGNRLLGELTSFYALMSFGIVSDLHVLHHSYPDTDEDPHNPAGIGFLNLLFTSQFRGIQVIEDKFYGYHGKTIPTLLIFKLNIVLHLLGNGLRLLVWYKLLGPLFYSVYLPGFLAYLFVFNHLNFATHKTDETGKVVVLNINSNLYYYATNWVCEGIYYHLNHHLYPRRTNPSRPCRRELERISKPLFTAVGRNALSLRPPRLAARRAYRHASAASLVRPRYKAFLLNLVSKGVSRYAPAKVRG